MPLRIRIDRYIRFLRTFHRTVTVRRFRDPDKRESADLGIELDIVAFQEHSRDVTVAPVLPEQIDARLAVETLVRDEAEDGQ